MIWRLRLHRMRRGYYRALRWAYAAGAIGMGAVMLCGMVGPHWGLHVHLEHGWPLALLGLCLLLAGAGHALSGEAPTVQEYAEGESDAMPASARMFSGLLASVGGVIMALMGLSTFMA